MEEESIRDELVQILRVWEGTYVSMYVCTKTCRYFSASSLKEAPTPPPPLLAICVVGRLVGGSILRLCADEGSRGLGVYGVTPDVNMVGCRGDKGLPTFNGEDIGALSDIFRRLFLVSYIFFHI